MFLYMYMYVPSGDDAVSSGLSEHSSDHLQPPPSKPIAPVLTVASQEGGIEGSNGSEPGDDDSELLTPSASESTLVNGKPITSENADTSSTKKKLQGVCCVHLHCMCMYTWYSVYLNAQS